MPRRAPINPVDHKTTNIAGKYRVITILHKQKVWVRPAIPYTPRQMIEQAKFSSPKYSDLVRLAAAARLSGSTRHKLPLTQEDFAEFAHPTRSPKLKTGLND